MIRRFISYYKPHRALFAFDMFCALLIALCDLFYPMIAKNMINDFIPNQNIRLLLIWAIVLLGVYLLKTLLNYIVCYYGHIVGVRMQGDMRRDMFRHLQKLPFSYFDETKSGTIMSRLINDLFDVSELAHHGPEDLFLSVLMLIGSFIALSLISLPLTLIIFSVIPFIVLFAVLMRRRMTAAFKKSREQIGEVNANIETAISGVRVSRAYTAEQHENAKFDVENKQFIRDRCVALKEMGKFHSVMTFFTDFLYLVVLVAAGLFFFYGKINIGEFTAFLLYINMFLNPIKRLISLFQQLQEGMTGFRRFTEIMDVSPEEESEDALTPEHLSGEIVFNNVTFSYEDEDADKPSKNVLHHLDLTIPQGKTLALVGPSGGGKTTVCNLIPRFYEIAEGSITIDGIDIRHMSRQALRRHIGIVSQDVFLFNGTVKENIAYGDLDASDDQIMEAAKKANIHDFIMTLEHGYDTHVGERGVKLSGGQKQRISIARVFLKNPSILILDEATSALDNATEMQIQAALESLSKGRTVVVVAHRLSTVKNADEIVVIDERGIAEHGTHDQLLQQDNGIYRELYAFQFR